MNGLALLMMIIYAIIVFVVAVPILLLIFGLTNRFLLGGKMKLAYRIALSIALPLIFIGGLFAYSYYEPYRTSIMDNRLEEIGLGIKLPHYKIANYVSAFVGGDDIKDTYTMEFKDDNVKLLIPQLDSLCNTSSKWTKDNDTYIFKVEFFEYEVYETFTINPQNRTAEFVHYKW